MSVVKRAPAVVARVLEQQVAALEESDAFVKGLTPQEVRQLYNFDYTRRTWMNSRT